MSNEHKERKRAWLISLHDSDCFYVTHNGACDCVEGVVAERAAIRMHEACVDAIKSLRATPRGAAYSNAVNDAIAKVESLTLDNEGQKK